MIIKNGHLLSLEAEDISQDGTCIIPEGVMLISGGACSDLVNLKKIVLPKSLVGIGSTAFCNCNKLKEIVIPDGIESIEMGTFSKCKKLEKVVIPESVKRIYENAFEFCESLKSIKIPGSVKTIGRGAFYHCTSLKTVELHEGLNTIDGSAFSFCHKLSDIEIPKSVKEIGRAAFVACFGLKNITIPEGVKRIEDRTFEWCPNLSSITLPCSVNRIGEFVFARNNSLKSVFLKVPIGFEFYSPFHNIYPDKFGQIKKFQIYKDMVELCMDDRPDGKYLFPFKNIEMIEKFLNSRNYARNFYQLNELKEAGEIKFIPPDYVLETFPHEQMKMFYHQNNNQRWGKLVKTLGFDTLPNDIEKNNSLIDLMKLYYAIGGFSDNQGESEMAYDYILKHVANSYKSSQEIADMVHMRFDSIRLGGDKYNKDFAKFFMRYYKDNPDFMVFRAIDESGYYDEGMQDYLCAAHNSFTSIQKQFPNRVVEGNTQSQLLSPKFVAEHCFITEYDNIEEPYERLAHILGSKSYSQDVFDEAQEVLDKAREIKSSGQYILKSVEIKNGNYIARVLEKDDEYGFVIGDEANCCQKFNGAAESCVVDGFESKYAGFTVIEQEKEDGSRKLLAQAFTWYDPDTKTLCYDNIEVPQRVLKQKDGYADLILDLIQKLSTKIVTKMKKDGFIVDKVTTGEHYNDLREELQHRFGAPVETGAENPNRFVYSDAKKQYIIMDYTKNRKDTLKKQNFVTEEDEVGLE